MDDGNQPKIDQDLIFQKVCRKNNNSQFYLNNRYIDIAQQYTYLGVSLTANGNFTSAQEKVKEKALHALFAVMKYTEIKRLPLKLANKVFDTLILPIFTYNSEVWVTYLKYDLNKLDQFNFEKVHRKFCKYYLGVNRKVVNDACRAELGRLPLKLVIEKQILSYLLHLQSLDTENLASKAYKLSVSLAMQNKTSYTRNISKMFDSYGMPHETENLDFTSKPKITPWMLIFKDKYISHWKNKIKKHS